MADRSDFNDLATESGSDAVALLINSALATAQAMPEEPPMVDYESRGSFSNMASRNQGQKPKERSSLELLRASDLCPKPISWLMPGRIALGKLTLFAGDPGLGKSQLTIAMASHVSRGADWPAGSGICPKGDVLFISAEDDPEDTIRPRLDAAGADASRIYIVGGVKSLDNQGDPARRSLSLRKDLAAIVEAVHSLDNCRLIVIDPVSAYMDGADSHNNSDVRGLLAPLSELASEVGAAMVAVTHLNKGGSGGSAMYRANGSLAFVAAARAAYVVTRDKQDETKRLFLPIKNNLGPDTSGLSFRILEKNGVPFVAFDDEKVYMSADDALGGPAEYDEESNQLEEAKDWLRDALSQGAVPSSDLQKLAKVSGYSWSTIRRAQTSLGIKPKKVGGAGAAGKWVWGLSYGEESALILIKTGEDS